MKTTVPVEPETLDIFVGAKEWNVLRVLLEPVLLELVVFLFSAEPLRDDEVVVLFLKGLFTDALGVDPGIVPSEEFGEFSVDPGIIL